MLALNSWNFWINLIKGIMAFLAVSIIISIIFLSLLENNTNDFVSKIFNIPSINKIQILAPMRYTTEDEIQKILLKANINERNFFNLDIKQIKHDLTQNNWIYDVDVKRLWPNKVRINFKEDEPMAYLNSNSIVLQRNCKIVDLTEDLKKLLHSKNDGFNYPELIADKKNTKKLCDTLEIIEKYVKPIDIGIKKLVVSQHNSFYVEFDNGLVVLLGKDNLVTRIERFVSYYKYINKKFAYVDMRYHYGLAVGTQKDAKLTEIMETA